MVMDDGGGEGDNSDFETLVTLIKGFVGIGILSLPYAISCGGYVGGPVGLICL